jgi:4'-phosphopantetheinyl transferase
VSVDDLLVAGNVAALALPAPLPGAHAWWRDLARDTTVEASDEGILSDDERARALRFGTPLLRARFVSGRATLRRLLGRWLALDPVDVPIARGRRGRPYVDATDAPDFNVSHTRDAAVIVLSTRRTVGVDLERRDRRVDAARLARKFLTSDERAAMASLADDAMREQFLRLWTCKEAMSKATGDGISAPMGRLTVTASAQGLRLEQGPPPYLPADWTLVAIDTPKTHFATLALWQPASAVAPAAGAAP